MRFRSAANVACVGILALACGSSAGADDDGNDAPTAGSATTGGSSGATATGSGGNSAGSSGTPASGAGAPSAGGMNATEGGGAGGGAGMGMAGGLLGGAAGSGGAGAAGMGSFFSGAGGIGDGGMSAGGRIGRGGRGSGGAGGMGMGGMSMGGAGMSMGGMSMGGAGSGCPASGHVTYTLKKATNPTADQQEAYDLITAAMDKALSYYNCYTNITKAETVEYNTGVQTADGNSNGNIRFGGKQYMEYSRAMHEIAHTVGIGTYNEFHDLTVDGIFQGQAATAKVREYTGNADEVVHADSQHFWPGGLNYASEAGSEKDVIYHCLLVVAIRKDMGFDP